MSSVNLPCVVTSGKNLQTNQLRSLIILLLHATFCLCGSNNMLGRLAYESHGLCVSRDYIGASAVGIKALLVRRPGVEGEGEHKEPGEDLTGVSVIHGLSEVVDEVLKSKLDGQSFQSST